MTTRPLRLMKKMIDSPITVILILLTVISYTFINVQWSVLHTNTNAHVFQQVRPSATAYNLTGVHRTCTFLM